MPRLLDLFRLNADSVNQTPARLRNLPPAPVEPEWDIRSGKPEPGLGQVTPEEWLPPGAGMKLAALAKGLAGKAAIAGTFIGAKHPSWMADAAEEALRLKAQGVDPREIWTRTRTFTEHPGVPAVQEISDARVAIDRRAMRTPMPGRPDYSYTPGSGAVAKELYPHTHLYSGYPELGDSKVVARIGNGVDSYGAYYPNNRNIDASAENLNKLKGVLTHEQQHGVQYSEGWPMGGNVASMFADPQTAPTARSIAAEFESAGMAPADARGKAAYETYRRLAGEAQAEAARARANLTDAQLTAKYPGDYYPVPLKDLLIRRGTGSSASDVAEARFPILGEQRLNQLLGDSGYSMNDKAKQGLTYVNPKNFVSATTPARGYPTAQDIQNEAGRFDPYKFSSERQYPLLELGTFPTVEGHEGRHRMSALAPYADRVPVVVQQPNSPGLYPYKYATLSNKTYGGQFEGSSPLSVGNIDPLSYSTPYDELAKYLTDVNIPLKDIGITLKPVGSNIGRDDLRAYRNPIPKGKIPPPIPKE